MRRARQQKTTMPLLLTCLLLLSSLAHKSTAFHQCSCFVHINPLTASSSSSSFRKLSHHLKSTKESSPSSFAADDAGTARSKIAPTSSSPTDDVFGGWSDDEFQQWMLQQLKGEASESLFELYPHVFEKAAMCTSRWRKRYRGNPGLWKRIFKKERVVKEVIEAIPILDATDRWMKDQKSTSRKQEQKVTIVDLCSGKGYLSMMLSEYLSDPSQVDKIILVDKAWPRCHGEPEPHHMNWDHIYANQTNDDDDNEMSSYFTTWPIPLHTSKQDLKKSSTLRQMKKRLSDGDTTILVLAVHLCGTLSLQAVQLMYQIPEIKALMLKPCCLPGLYHSREKTNFEIGRGRYSFPTKDVCASGQWSQKKWKGPPRWHLEQRFNNWCYHLHQGMSSLDKVESKLFEVPVQHKGGYQNTFLLAEKVPTSPGMWSSFESLSIDEKH